jgi:hypothetical protein
MLQLNDQKKVLLGGITTLSTKYNSYSKLENQKYYLSIGFHKC